jgi:hypothetical protein
MRCTLIVYCMRASPGTGNMQLGHPLEKEILHYSQEYEKDKIFLSYIHLTWNAMTVSALSMLRLSP